MQMVFECFRENELLRVCRASNCERTDVLARGLCPNCYQRWRSWGESDFETDHRLAKPRPDCSVDGCMSPMRLNGFCVKHNSRFKRHGDPTFTLRDRRVMRISETDRLPCKEPDCTELDKVQGYCRRHYNKDRRAKNRSLYKVYNLRRRARKLDAQVCDYTLEQVSARASMWGDKCWMCGGPFECIDHVKPLSKGGKDCPANMRPACFSCNSTKNAKWFGVQSLSLFIRR
jgi:5-methylcytosine-specific restriction endonuclease McrA